MAAPKDAYSGFNFIVEIDGLAQAGFSEVTGLSAETNAGDYRDGSVRTGHDKLTGIPKGGALRSSAASLAPKAFTTGWRNALPAS